MEAEDHMDRPDFPTMEEVEKATHEQLARWYRFLPSGDTKERGVSARAVIQRLWKVILVQEIVVPNVLISLPHSLGLRTCAMHATCFTRPSS
jgi:hypothetical protein